MFEVKYSNRATKFLKNCDKNIAERVLEKIEILRENPIIPETIKVKGEDTLRVRVGKVRILYIIKGKDNKLLIVKIEKRPHAYD
ncbi:type II toxin-antitoxin system RelE/ParE family toxin [Candidatus Pacearchaeota archaeon]|nr:type II toxin-antitoxin system RelE/ParE family toxin [Candidatus Pacearchaeota archaeon]